MGGADLEKAILLRAQDVRRAMTKAEIQCNLVE